MNLKPREKLIHHGPECLSNSDLIAIILSHATKKESVFDLSKRILKEYGQSPLKNIQNVNKCKKLLGVGLVHASKLIACFELGKRFFGTGTNSERVTNAKDVYKHLIQMTKLKKEYICGLYLNSRNMLIYEEILAIGTLDNSSLHPRDVFRPAIERNAYTVIIVHNHPSGDPTPSEDDIFLTNEIEKAGNLLRIPLLDHIILANGAYFSFHEQKIFKV